MDDTTQQNPSQSSDVSTQQANSVVSVVQDPVKVAPQVQTASDSSSPQVIARPSADKTVSGRQMRPVTSVPSPQQPVSSGSKESEPAVHSKADVDKMTEPEIIAEEKAVEKEISEIVKEAPDTEKPKLPEDVQKAGVTLAKEATPMLTQPSGSVVLPMTLEEAQVTRKKYKWKNSISWLATVIIYQFKKLNNKAPGDNSGFG